MSHTCKHDAETLKQLQALPLRAKVFESRQRIAEWVKHWGEDKVYVAFSGGKDSTVLLDLVRRDYPDVPAVFCDTGLEYPEVIDFVKTVANVTWLKPKMKFKAVIEKYGYPVVSKEQSECIYQLRKHNCKPETRAKWLHGIGKRTGRRRLSKKWHYLLDAPFMCSHKCCDVMKKEPMNRYSKESCRKGIVGTMTEDSDLRQQNYLEHGCNLFDVKNPLSKPMSFWLVSDVWEYLHSKNVPYSSIYDMGYERTGCMFCAFGAHLNSPNRFQRMHDTHPKQWKYCMDKLGMREVLAYCGIPVEDKQLKLDL